MALIVVSCPMMFRYLRIAVSALSLTAFVLLIALWARSYYYFDQLTEPISRIRGIEFASIEGQARFAVLKLNPAVPFQSQDWGLESTNSKLQPGKGDAALLKRASSPFFLLSSSSKRWDNHRAALAVFFCHYNYCRKHRSLKGLTPAMAHGLTTEVWTVRKMLETVTGS